MYFHTRNLQNTLYHLAWSSAEAVLFRYRPLSHLWRLPETMDPKLYTNIIAWMSTYTKNHRKALHPTHICGFQVALN